MQWNKKFWRVHFKIFKKRFHSRVEYKSFALSLLAILIMLPMISFYYLNQSDSEISSFTRWQGSQAYLAKRSPASTLSQQVQCYDHISIHNIKKEIKKLEFKYQTGSVIEGKFYGLDLTSLPSIGAQMLADFKNQIGDRNNILDFSQCKGNIPCVFNKIYNDQTELSGHYIYYWYLKTGSMLSTANFLPNQTSVEAGEYNRKKFEFSQYLFSREELQKFYLLAKGLPEKLKFIPLLKSIHKVPSTADIEGFDSQICSVSLPNGQILLKSQCLDHQFNLVVTKEIARFADRHEGLKQRMSHLSHSKEWLQFGSWKKESFFNKYSHKFEYRWKHNIPSKYIFDVSLSRSPSEHLATAIAHYRYNPEEFKAKVPSDLRHWLKEKFFHNTSFDSEGLYKQFTHSSLDIWSRQEVGLWKDCIKENLKDKTIHTLQKDVLASLEHPLYSCVEQKIPEFISFLKTRLKDEYTQGCHFFNDNKLAHVANRFHRNINKFLLEKILQRKLEIQRHGPEVLVGQVIKEEFIKSTDPKSIYIQCFAKSEPETCYQLHMNQKIAKIIKKHKGMSKYYHKIITEDIQSLYPFHYVKKTTNEAAKHFLAPFAARISQAANKMWNSCKKDGMDHGESLKLPMKFSGGRYFVNPKLINCINEKVDSELVQLTDLKAFQVLDGIRTEFKLNKTEQKFALSFLEGNLLQTLNNLLDDEYFSEKQRFDQYFHKARLKAVSEFQNDADLMENVFSHQQVENLCMQKIAHFYPQNYFYHSKPQMDKIYGKKICNKFVTQPDINKTLNAQFHKQWLKNRAVATQYLANNYQSLVDDCYSRFEVVASGKNKPYRDHCIRDSFGEAISEAIMEWREHKHYAYFERREQEVLNYFTQRLRGQFISKASMRAPLLEEERKPANQ